MKKAALVNWRTTLGGAITALGLGLQSPEAVGTVPDWLISFAPIFVVVGPLLVGWAARDSNVSSEKSGAS